ncbi:hypothetical protein [Acidovorax sp.]|uniref:hypothetical protein n=1 Tax=Acidovorax sp. TaxID=1872122 RepID=UPI003CFFC9BF
MAAAVTSADVCTTHTAPAPKPAPTFEQLPLSSCSLSPQEAGRWLSVIIPLLKYAGSPGDWGRESKLGVLTMRLMQARAEIMALRPEDVVALASAPFVHVPRPPEVNKDHPDQRYFGRNDYGGYGMPVQADPDSRIRAHRFASDSVAHLRMFTGHRAGLSAEITAPLKPAELRELAQVLLDAAHDIETNSSAQLLAEIEAARGAA